MTLTTGATLTGLAAVAAVAWSLGGPVGTGVLAGGLLAASVTLFGLLWQRHALRVESARGGAPLPGVAGAGGALGSVVGSFLIKLAALGLGAACLRFVEPAAARADWQGFVLGFVALAVFVLIPGTLDNVRAQKVRAQNVRAERARLDATTLEETRAL